MRSYTRRSCYTDTSNGRLKLNEEPRRAGRLPGSVLYGAPRGQSSVIVLSKKLSRLEVCVYSVSLSLSRTHLRLDIALVSYSD